MDDNSAPLLTKKDLGTCGFLTLLFFVFMTWVCQSHVPAQTIEIRYLFGAYGALCLSLVCFLSLVLLRATWIDQRRRKASAA